MLIKVKDALEGLIASKLKIDEQKVTVDIYDDPTLMIERVMIRVTNPFTGHEHVIGSAVSREQKVQSQDDILVHLIKKAIKQLRRDIYPNQALQEYYEV